MDEASFLTKGSQVEVSSDEDGFNGAWFVATVIQPPPSVSTSKRNTHHTRNNLVYVEYHNLLTEDGSSRRLREYANVSYVRPSPAPDTNVAASSFQLNDLVDAFYRDGWWTGIITQVLDASNFLVTFQNPPDQIQFHFSHLRLHRKWVAGRWVQPDKQRTAGLMFTVGKKVEVSFDTETLRDVWFPATVLKNSANNSFVVEYQQPGVGDLPAQRKVTVDYLHIRPSPPHLRDKNFVLLEKVDAYYDFGWWSGVITKELADNRYNVFFKNTNKEREFIYSRVRPHMEWKGGNWFNTSQGDTDGRTGRSLMPTDEQTTPNNNNIGKDSSSVINKITKQTVVGSSNDENSVKDDIPADPPVDIEGSDSQAFAKTENLSHGKKVHSKRGKGGEVETPKTNSSRKKGRLANELKGLKTLGEGGNVDSVKRGRSQEEDVEREELGHGVVVGLQCDGKKLERNLDVAESVPLPVIDKEGDGESVAPKRKRGRPPKLQGNGPETLLIVNHENGGDVVEMEGSERNAAGLEEEQRAGKDSDNPNANNADNGNGNGNGPTSTSKEKEGADVRIVRKRYSSRKGKKGKRRTISVNTTDSPPQDPTSCKEKADGQLQLDKDSATKTPGSTCASDDQPLSRWLVQTVDAPERSLEQSSEIGLELMAGDDDENRFPFVRSMPLWQTLESMEAFHKIPQKPHFRPLMLEGVKESAREGLAIGSMVTYSTVVDKTCGLRFDDPRSAIEDCLETLVELESHGFDVEVIRERLTGLLLIKDKQEELEEQSKGVVHKIEKQKAQGKAADEEIAEIDRRIKELQQKRKELALMKEKRGCEIGVMKAAQDEIQRQMTQIRLKFDGLAAAPF